MNKVFLGTQIKLNIHIEPMGKITMDDYDFVVEVRCSTSRSILATKSDMIREDNNNYIVLVDTNELGSGSLKCKVTAHVPDTDFPDSLRTEVVVIDTGISVIKSL